MAWLTIGLTIASLVWYVVVGLSRKSSSANEEQYFIAGQSVSANDYANMSVGYALQMAALFLFAYWGFIYGVGALWTALFWALGYGVLYWLLPQFREYRSTAGRQTLHSFIRSQFSSSVGLQKTAAAATLIGLLGTMLAEVDYTVAVYHPIGFVKPVVLQLVFLGIGLVYIIWNGFKAEVRTERIQVPLAYIGLLAVLLVAIPEVYLHSGVRAFSVVVGGTAATLVLMAVAKSIDITARTRRFRWLDWQLAIPLVALSVLAVETVWVLTQLSPGAAANILDTPISTQLVAQGGMGLASLLVANALWMPVDVSTWQRVGAVEGNDAEAAIALRKGTMRVLFESPASWCLGAILGWTISAGGYVPANYPDPYSVVSAFADQLFQGRISSQLGSWQTGFYAVFVVACVAIMLSTITSILSAVSFTTDRDLLPDNQENVSRVRILSTIIVVLGFVSYEGLRSLFKANLPTLLYGAYSAQLCLFVVTILALFRRRLNAHAALFSISLGLGGAVISTTIAILNPSDAELAIMPPLVAVLASAIGYVIGYEFLNRRRRMRRV